MQIERDTRQCSNRQNRSHCTGLRHMRGGDNSAVWWLVICWRCQEIMTIVWYSAAAQRERTFHNLLFTPIFHSVADSLSAPRAIYESQRAVMAIDIASLSMRFYAVLWVCQYLCACEIVAIPNQYVCKKLLKSDNV